MKSGTVIVAVLAGAAAGVLLGVLFAPDLGWNTRKRLSKRGEDYLDALEDKFNEFLENISIKIDESEVEGSDFSLKSKIHAEGIRVQL